MYADFARELKASSGVDIEYRVEGTLYLALTEEDEEELGPPLAAPTRDWVECESPERGTRV